MQKERHRKYMTTGLCRISKFSSVSFLFFLFFQIFGCNQKIHNPNEGMNQTQILAFRIISESLNSDNNLLKTRAIETAVETKQPNFIPAIERLLHDPYVPVRFAASVAVGDMQDKAAINSINELLKDKEPNVIIAAAYAMAKIDNPQYLDVLRGTLANNTAQVNDITKANSALLLGKSGDRNSIPLLSEVMKNPQSSDKVSYGAAEALSMLGDDKIFETNWGMLISAYADVKMLGINNMGTLGTPQAENALLTMLEDPITEIRLATALQLGKMNNKTGQKVVLEVFQKNLNTDPDFQTRERINVLTALAIGEIGTQNVTKFLPELMKNESPFVRLAAAKAVFMSSLNK
jgi:HEAT repeat protein